MSYIYDDMSTPRGKVSIWYMSRGSLPRGWVDGNRSPHLGPVVKLAPGIRPTAPSIS